MTMLKTIMTISDVLRQKVDKEVGIKWEAFIGKTIFFLVNTENLLTLRIYSFMFYDLGNVLSQ